MIRGMRMESGYCMSCGKFVGSLTPVKSAQHVRLIPDALATCITLTLCMNRVFKRKGNGEQMLKVEYHRDMTLDEWAAKIADWRQRKEFETHWGNLEQKMLLFIEEIMEAHKRFRALTFDSEPVISRNQIREELADCVIRLLDFLGSTEGEDMEPTGKIFVRLMEQNEDRPIRHNKRF